MYQSIIGGIQLYLQYCKNIYVAMYKMNDNYY